MYIFSHLFHFFFKLCSRFLSVVYNISLHAIGQMYNQLCVYFILCCNGNITVTSHRRLLKVIGNIRLKLLLRSLTANTSLNPENKRTSVSQWGCYNETFHSKQDSISGTNRYKYLKQKVIVHCQTVINRWTSIQFHACSGKLTCTHRNYSVDVHAEQRAKYRTIPLHFNVSTDIEVAYKGQQLTKNKKTDY